MPEGDMTEAAARDWCAAHDMVLVSRLFWVAAANAVRKAAGHVTADEPAMSDSEAWEYVRRRILDSRAP